MGFSMLSLLEIVYHATLRMICKSYRQRSDRQKMSSGGRNFNERKRSKGWNNNDDDDDMHPVKFPDERSMNNGFLRKLFQRSYMVGKNTATVTKDNISKFNNSAIVTNTIKKNGNAPIFLKTPFESDFHKPYLATLWEMQEQVPETLAEVGNTGKDKNYKNIFSFWKCHKNDFP